MIWLAGSMDDLQRILRPLARWPCDWPMRAAPCCCWTRWLICRSCRRQAVRVAAATGARHVRRSFWRGRTATGPPWSAVQRVPRLVVWQRCHTRSTWVRWRREAALAFLAPRTQYPDGSGIEPETAGRWIVEMCGTVAVLPASLGLRHRLAAQAGNHWRWPTSGAWMNCIATTC